MSKTPCTEFGKAVKKKLIDLNQSLSWLESQISARTGLFMDSGYMHKILTGQRNAPKIVKAIREILDISDAPQA